MNGPSSISGQKGLGDPFPDIFLFSFSFTAQYIHNMVQFPVIYRKLRVTSARCIRKEIKNKKNRIAVFRYSLQLGREKRVTRPRQ